MWLELFLSLPCPRHPWQSPKEQECQVQSLTRSQRLLPEGPCLHSLASGPSPRFSVLSQAQTTRRGWLLGGPIWKAGPPTAWPAHLPIPAELGA